MIALTPAVSAMRAWTSGSRARSCHPTSPGNADRSGAWSAARDALELVGLPTDPDSRVDALGAAGLKKLELAKALATRPRLLLADESLGGLDDAEMDQAAVMLRRIREEMGITIIWVEHIMGVLMRWSTGSWSWITAN